MGLTKGIFCGINIISLSLIKDKKMNTVYAMAKGTLVVSHLSKYPIVRTGYWDGDRVLDFGGGGAFSFTPSGPRSGYRTHQLDYDEYSLVQWTNQVVFESKKVTNLFGCSNNIKDLSNLRYKPQCYWGEVPEEFIVPELETNGFSSGYKNFRMKVNLGRSTFNECITQLRSVGAFQDIVMGGEYLFWDPDYNLKIVVKLPYEAKTFTPTNTYLNQTGKAIIFQIITFIEGYVA